MKLHLDTHTLLWYAWADPRLPARAVQAIRDPDNTVFVSAVSLWEIVIKSSLGKLTLAIPVAEFLTKHVDANGFHTIPISRTHLLAFHALPFHHRDPFDRLLIAQSLADGLTFVTGDAQMTKYNVNVLWD